MCDLSLYHFHVTQIKRSAGQSAIASAAYRSGEKLYSQYYGETSDYTRKSGVVCSEILLPSHAPPEPMLMEIVMQYFDKKSASVWSMHRKLGYLKRMTESFNFLREYDLNTLADLEARRAEHQVKLDAKTAVCRNLESRMKEVENLLR